MGRSPGPRDRPWRRVHTGFSRPRRRQHITGDALRARGLTTVAKVNKINDVSGSLGGPIAKDRLWFFTSHRRSYANNQVPGGFYNKTQGTPFYTPDPSRPAYTEDTLNSHAVRLTWQASQKNKFSFFGNLQNECNCKRPVGPPPAAAEAQTAWHYWPAGLFQGTWTMPVTTRLLLQAGGGAMIAHWPNEPQPEVGPNDISIIDASTGVLYNAYAPLGSSAAVSGIGDGYGGPKVSNRYSQRFAVSYVTGSHSVKGGIQVEDGYRHFHVDVNGDVQYTFLGTRPTGITQYATPVDEKERFRSIGLFIQDQWTIGRLTLNGGVRYDHVNGWVPAQSLPAARFVPARDFAPVNDVPNWSDISPRVGGSYDLFGTGKTALKVAFGRYLGSNGTGTGQTARANPMFTSVNVASRTWNDGNGNYVPDCILTNPLANGECGTVNNLNFGSLNTNATRFSSDVLSGWRKRDYLWDFSTEIQHELMTGWSVVGGYYRNSYGNFVVNDNLRVAPEDYSPYCVTAPSDARLPGGGGYQVCGLYDLNPSRLGQVANFVQQASSYGKQIQKSDFFDITLNARVRQDVLFKAGFDLGRTVQDLCYVVDNPGAVVSGTTFVAPFNATTINGQSICRIEVPFSAQTQVKLSGTYTLPFPGQFALSATFQNVPGPVVLASYAAPNSVIAPSLGRNLGACGAAVTCVATATVPLMVPQTQRESRWSQLDFRVSKTVKLSGRSELSAHVDLYNMLNGSGILTINTTYGSQWRRPSTILPGRLVQFGGRFSF